MLVVGVDGGNTKTQCVVSDTKGNILGFSTGGNTNYGNRKANIELMLNELKRILNKALSMAKAEPDDVRAVVWSLAGIDTHQDIVTLRKPLGSIFPDAKMNMINDAIGGLWGATQSFPAVYVSIGTGWTSAGRSCAGREILLDNLNLGGDVNIHNPAIHAVIRMLDGRGQPTSLLRYLAEMMHLRSQKDLPDKLYVSFLNNELPAEFKLKISKIIIKAHLKGDIVASEILLRAGREHGAMARALLKRLNVKPDTHADVRLGGGLYTKGKCSFLIESATVDIHREFPNAEVRLPDFLPVIGAVLLGLTLLGTKPYKYIDNIRRSIPEKIRKNGLIFKLGVLK